MENGLAIFSSVCILCALSRRSNGCQIESCKLRGERETVDKLATLQRRERADERRRGGASKEKGDTNTQWFLANISLWPFKTHFLAVTICNRLYIQYICRRYSAHMKAFRLCTMCATNDWTKKKLYLKIHMHGHVLLQSLYLFVFHSGYVCNTTHPLLFQRQIEQKNHSKWKKFFFVHPFMFVLFGAYLSHTYNFSFTSSHDYNHQLKSFTMITFSSRLCPARYFLYFQFS